MSSWASYKFCFQDNPEDGEYDEHFQLFQSKVAEIMDTLLEAHMESLAEVIPALECQGADVCLELYEKCFKIIFSILSIWRSE